MTTTSFDVIIEIPATKPRWKTIADIGESVRAVRIHDGYES